MAMARRGKVSHTHWIILAAVVFIAVLGSLIIFRDGNTPYRTLPELNPRDYHANSNSLRGNVYRVQGEVDSSLAWSPSLGRLISVKVDENNALPVRVTKEFDGMNLQKGQKFNFMLEVDQNGILFTKDLKKA